MSASSVILRGYKGGTLVTRGYSVGEEAAVVTPALRDVSGHGRPDRLSPRELAELHVAEALRNTPDPAKTPDSVTPSDVPDITTGVTVPAKQNVVRIDDYRNPPLDNIDAAIDSVNIRINALIKSKMAKDANDLLVLEQIAAADEELAITLLLLD